MSTMPSRHGEDRLSLFEEFVSRFAPQYVGRDTLDYERLVKALQGRRPGAGGVMHAFDDQGGSTLTGLSYQSSIEDVLDAVLCGIAGRLLRDLPDAHEAARTADAMAHPLAGLLASRVQDLAGEGQLRRTLALVSTLRGDRERAPVRF